MYLHKLITPLFIYISPLLAQRTASPLTQTLNTNLSQIIKVDENSPVKVELKNAAYDGAKNYLPYYLASYTTGYQQDAVPVLEEKKVVVINNQAAVIIKKYYAKYLGNNFQLEARISLSAGQNLNTYQLYPFRINAQGQVEELTDYEIKWQVKTASARTTLSAATFTNNSVLSTGNWYKIGLTQTGIYKIDKTFLTKAGIDVTKIDPRNIRIYGNGGIMTPEANADFRHDDLKENAIKVIGESDGVFNDNDYVLFYATDVNKWKWQKGSNKLIFTREKNLYSDSSFYFITADLGPGKRIVNQTQSTLPANTSSSAYDYRNHHENDMINLIKSGREFYGEYFDITNSYSFSFNEGNFVTGDTLRTEVSIAARANTRSFFSITGNGINSTLIDSAVDVNYYLAPYANEQKNFSKALNQNAANISLNITKLTGNAIGWLNRITINARRNLIVSKQFCFRDTRVTNPGNVCDFNLTNTSGASLNIWNVTDPLNPTEIEYTSTGTNLSFRISTDSLLEFATAPLNNLLTPAFTKKIENQNLHAIAQADYVIVTHPLFVQQAQRLANLHQANEGLTYAIATTEQVYNEFGSGKAEATAIRDFTRMLYSRNISTQKQPKYLLLFGDGSYNNINHNLNSNTALIPTYHNENSLEPLYSVVSDDFYGLMDPNEGLRAESVGGMDIGVGRIMTQNTSEANGVVSKIENYYRKDPAFKIDDSGFSNCSATNEIPMGDWRNWLLFMGDDEDRAGHMIESNTIADWVQSQYPTFNIDKIYLDAYQQFSTPGGKRYPDANKDMNARIKKGTLIFNYTGHGGEVGLADERVLDMDDINEWDNFNKLPLFITATCEFSRYDDPGRTSAGERCLLNSKGGAIALFTTCRVAYSTSNFILNNALFNYMFKKLANGKSPCLGDITRRTKASLGQNLNYSNFHLLGDPAITLSVPENIIKTSLVNDKTITVTSSDTLGALSKIKVSGIITDTLGNKLTNFNGIIYPTVFDKIQDVTCIANDPNSAVGGPGGPLFNFKLQKNILYRGKTSATNGEFSFSFLVPKDISFSYGPGKISYYATNGLKDASGYYKNIVIGGESKNAVSDNEGPNIKLYLNDKNFVSGGTTNEKPFLYAYLTDSSGVNTIGLGIGHDISAILDGQSTKQILLNDYYEASLNTYQSGRVRYQFDKLSEGNHNLSFKVWDIQNNSNTVSVDFVVANSGEIALSHVLNYPNPFTSKTGFFFEHNQACSPLKTSIQIFTISGKLVKTIAQDITCEGFRTEGITWDGKDDFGNKLARGVYVYKIGITNQENKKAEKIEKLVILN